MMKLYNFSLGGNATTPNIKEESVTSSICVCYVCVKQYACVCLFILFYFIFKKNLKQCVKKKKSTQKNYALNNEFQFNELSKPKKKSRNTTKSHDIFTIPLFLAMVGPILIFYYFILKKCYIHNIFIINLKWKIATSFKLG